MSEKHIVTPDNAAKMWDWLNNRGGLAIWSSIDFGFITDASEVVVSVDKEVKRFHVAVRPGSQGMSFKCTDASTRKIRKEVERAGVGAYYEFDYSTQDAVIMAPESQMPLAEWIAAHPA